MKIYLDEEFKRWDYLRTIDHAALLCAPEFGERLLSLTPFRAPFSIVYRRYRDVWAAAKMAGMTLQELIEVFELEGYLELAKMLRARFPLSGRPLSLVSNPDRCRPRYRSSAQHKS